MTRALEDRRRAALCARREALDRRAGVGVDRLDPQLVADQLVVVLGVGDRRLEQLRPVRRRCGGEGEDRPSLGHRLAANVVADESRLARRGAHVARRGIDDGRGAGGLGPPATLVAAASRSGASIGRRVGAGPARPLGGGLGRLGCARAARLGRVLPASAAVADSASAAGFAARRRRGLGASSAAATRLRRGGFAARVRRGLGASSAAASSFGFAARERCAWASRRVSPQRRRPRRDAHAGAPASPRPSRARRPGSLRRPSADPPRAGVAAVGPRRANSPSLWPTIDSLTNTGRACGRRGRRSCARPSPGRSSTSATRS